MTSIGNTTMAMQQLLDRLVAGDERAKKELIDRAYERLILVARKMLGGFTGVRAQEETAGVLSDAYLRLHSSLDDVKPATVRQFMGLAALEIRRVLLDKIRKMRGRGRERRPEKLSLDARRGGESGGFEPPAPDGEGRKMDLAIDFLQAIEKLPDEEREVVELLFFHGYSQPEAGEILGVHEDTVKRRWARARVKLAEKLSAFS
jgi:RNA polymerase sigma factor (TIGR02999 family)